jgi:hypothetical protein
VVIFAFVSVGAFLGWGEFFGGIVSIPCQPKLLRRRLYDAMLVTFGM